jgi:hypothetical protein
MPLRLSALRADRRRLKNWRRRTRRTSNFYQDKLSRREGIEKVEASHEKVERFNGCTRQAQQVVAMSKSGLGKSSGMPNEEMAKNGGASNDAPRLLGPGLLAQRA